MQIRALATPQDAGMYRTAKGAHMQYTYSAILIPSETGDKFFSKIPELPGCVTSGRDRNDAIAQITDAAANWLIVAEDDGLPIPSPQRELARERHSVVSVVQIDTLVYREKSAEH